MEHVLGLKADRQCLEHRGCKWGRLARIRDLSLRSGVVFAGFLAVSLPAQAQQIRDPGRQVVLSGAAKSWSVTRDYYNNTCMLQAKLAAGKGTPEQAKAVLNIFGNMCSCMANDLAKVWEAYGRDNTVAAMALGRVNTAAIASKCQSKYVTPYFQQ